MERLSKIIIGIIAASLVLGWLIEPAFVIFGGITLFVILFLYLGGAEDGNPYRTMRANSMPDFLEVGRYMKQQKVQKERPPQRNLTWLLLISGALLIAIGLYWMHVLGQI
jgi:hypothetical protein